MRRPGDRPGAGRPGRPRPIRHGRGIERARGAGELVRLAVVGATGAVGTVILRILEERALAISELVPVATARSAERLISHRGRELEVRAISAEVFEGVDIALFDTPDEA
ncbi:MAG: hypothetical protein H0V36_02335, partial [Chloroflexi bacterium]|nr:hypothetical protein [Chloroflexota bacterium]